MIRPIRHIPHSLSIALGLACGSYLVGATPLQNPWHFDGPPSRAVLERYLSRAVTFAELLHGRGNFEDHLRFLTHTGAKFVGRAIYRWGGEAALPELAAKAQALARRVHAVDPDIILQACCFEIVSTEVNRLAVPPRVFEAFGLPAQNRHFRYEDMLYPNGQGRNQWRPGASVPDMSQLETQLWFYYLATTWIDLGVEAIHFGQVEIMDDRDPQHRHWSALLEKIRHYARAHARRHWVWCDAHVPSGGILHNGRLLFDFHSFPLRIKEVPTRPQEGVLEMGWLDSIYGRSRGGITPAGWPCDHLPYLVELDDYGVSDHPGWPGSPYFVWGWDEISWFAHQPEEYRNHWLRYAWDWIRRHDPNGWLQMPASRVLHAPVNGRFWYWAHQPSPATPDGFNQEPTIRAIWNDAAKLSNRFGCRSARPNPFHTTGGAAFHIRLSNAAFTSSVTKLHGAMDDPGRLLNLNDPHLSWSDQTGITLTSAEAINDAGLIVANGYWSSRSTWMWGFVLEPQPVADQ